MMNSKNAINEIHALVANSEVNDEVAEKLLAISSWLEAEQEEHCLEPSTWIKASKACLHLSNT